MSQPAGYGCQVCGSLTFSQEWHEAFGVILCNSCKMEESLVSKGTAKQDWLLTDGDMKKLGSISKENPHKKEWSAMRLYLLSQVEKRSMEKHGDLDGLEAEKQRQLQLRLEARKRQRQEASSSKEDREAQKLKQIRGRFDDELQRTSSDAGRPHAAAEVEEI